MLALGYLHEMRVDRDCLLITRPDEPAMNRLIVELQRLYFLSGQQCQGVAAGRADLTCEAMLDALQGGAAPGIGLSDAQGKVRTLGLEFHRSGDWPVVAGLLEALQDGLDLPLPAVSVAGLAGFRLWFSLDEPLPREAAQRFLALLSRQYLTAIPAHQLARYPGDHEVMPLVPALHPESGKWSAFIDPTMGSMFVDEAGLEMAPNMDRQADILLACKSIKTADFQRALQTLVELDASVETPPDLVSGGASRSADQTPRSTFDAGRKHDDPVSFLLAVMNESSVDIRERIEAAKALLPYFPAGRPQ